MKNILEVFEARGFFEQSTDKASLSRMLTQATTCYIGFDPTAKSLHVGSLLPIMSLVHMQNAGHRPVVLVGGGTALVGDPSGKTEMRRIMSREEIDENAMGLKNQLSNFIDFSGDRAVMANNADWLTELKYVDFLRDIGRHFSVNRMLAAESYKLRMETGLSFIEFNYMLLQAYDFWHLFKYYDCRLQMGGNDQWGNILAGADLIRRLEGEVVHGLTFPLLTTASGIKMGKTHQGAVWLDGEMTSPYDYYQYWVNQDDGDIGRFLAIFTLLDMDEINRLKELKGSEIRDAKKILAYEATRLCHGKENAEQARAAAEGLFGGSREGGDRSAPSYEIGREILEDGIPAYILFENAGLCKTRGEARRLISQGGGYLNDQKISVFDQTVGIDDLVADGLLLRAGKKRYMKIVPGS
ncbi:MAG: tyrosine--tRNA ligase [Deltaproteobacteria bacterium]|nr:tyrosine--tRNA ligase [Deltaproteobacteria bacterium]